MNRMIPVPVSQRNDHVRVRVGSPRGLQAYVNTHRVNDEVLTVAINSQDMDTACLRATAMVLLAAANRMDGLIADVVPKCSPPAA